MWFRHAISHGFEVVIYEATDRPGGIWSRENKSSGLQLNSLLYRFHPAVIWKETYPKRDEILQGAPGV
jgi:cation diffusion facilitator CzcD-associated flavoprotein CzcO